MTRTWRFISDMPNYKICFVDIVLSLVERLLEVKGEKEDGKA